MYHVIDFCTILVYIAIHASQTASPLPSPKAHPYRARRAAETRTPAPKAHDRHRLSARGHLTHDAFSSGSRKPSDRSRDTRADSLGVGAGERSRHSRARRQTREAAARPSAPGAKTSPRGPPVKTTDPKEAATGTMRWK